VQYLKDGGHPCELPDLWPLIHTDITKFPVKPAQYMRLSGLTTQGGENLQFSTEIAVFLVKGTR